MIKLFYLLGGLLFLMLSMVGIHYLLADKKGIVADTNAVASLSRISSLSLSTAWYEPRLRGIEKAGNDAYPEMMPIDRMDFVYAE
jgi:hypothetical protein